MKNILIVKFGALGDVVRTSFFAEAIRRRDEFHGMVRIYWLTHPSSVPLLRFNPHIDHIVTSFDDVRGVSFDEVYSLENEITILEGVRELKAECLIGAFLDEEGKPGYCDRSAGWFDMGLLSKFGRSRADELKMENVRTHAEIFAEIFRGKPSALQCYNSPVVEQRVKAEVRALTDGAFVVGINAFAGARWPSKSLAANDLLALVERLSTQSIKGRPVHLCMIGGGNDTAKNAHIWRDAGRPSNVHVCDTDATLLELMALVGAVDLLVTSDSLALHLAVGQQVPIVSFFAPTSAAEIENTPRSAKVKSTAADYCTYRPNADNSTITADRIVGAVDALLSEMGIERC